MYHIQEHTICSHMLEEGRCWGKWIAWHCRSVVRSVVEYACLAWSTGITKEQSDSLEQIQKRAMYIIDPHLQYKAAITRFNLPTIKDRLDILNSDFVRNIVDNDSHRLHYLLPKPHAAKKTLCSTGKYETPKCCTNWFKGWGIWMIYFWCIVF